MKRTLLYIIAALAVLAFGFGTSAALADQPPAPPGQDPCSHGNTGKPCKEDPSPNGKDCDEHGNNGGINEDHCKGETTPPPPCSVNCGPPPPCSVNCGPPPPCTVNCGPPPPCTVNCGGPPPCKVNCGGDTTTTQTTTTTQATTPTPPAAVVPPAVKPPAAKPPKAKDPKASVTKKKLGTALVKQAKPDATPSSETQATGELPNTGVPLFPLALLGGGLTGIGGWMRRRFPR